MRNQETVFCEGQKFDARGWWRTLTEEQLENIVKEMDWDLEKNRPLHGQRTRVTAIELAADHVLPSRQAEGGSEPSTNSGSLR